MPGRICIRPWPPPRRCAGRTSSRRRSRPRSAPGRGAFRRPARGSRSRRERQRQFAHRVLERASATSSDRRATTTASTSERRAASACACARAPCTRASTPARSRGVLIAPSLSRTPDSSRSDSSLAAVVAHHEGRPLAPSPPGRAGARRAPPPARARARRRARGAAPRRRRPRSSRRSSPPYRPRTAAAPRPRPPAAPARARAPRASQLADPRARRAATAGPRASARSSSSRERAARDRRPIDHPAGRDLRPQRSTTASRSARPRVELVHDRVGREHLRAEPLERRQRGRLARAHAAGQPDERDRRLRRHRRSAAQSCGDRRRRRLLPGSAAAARLRAAACGLEPARPSALRLASAGGSATSATGSASARRLGARPPPRPQRRVASARPPAAGARRSASQGSAAAGSASTARQLALRLATSAVQRLGLPGASCATSACGRLRLGDSPASASLGGCSTASACAASLRSLDASAASPAAEACALGARHRQDLVLDALGRQRQAPALGVDLEDLDADLLARLDDLARVLDVVRGELGDVHEPLDAVEDLDEGAEGDDLGDACPRARRRCCRCRRSAARGPPGSA